MKQIYKLNDLVVKHGDNNDKPSRVIESKIIKLAGGKESHHYVVEQDGQEFMTTDSYLRPFNEGPRDHRYFINDWSGWTSDEVIAAFNNYDETDATDANKDVEVVFASYDGGDWDGTAFVLAMKDNKLYEVHASHCSCYGLEDQFNLEETSPEYLKRFIEEGKHYYSGHMYVKELAAFLLDKYGIVAELPEEFK